MNLANYFNSWAIAMALTLISMSPSLKSEETLPLFKNQKQSSTKWGGINLSSFLDLKTWKDQRADRDKVLEWESIVRERNHQEIVGRFFQCVGLCRVNRGQGFFNPSFRTSIYEGDEIQTIGESYAWIFLFDGTLVRLSPESSINLNELNVGKKENFISARVNAGNVLWLSRDSFQYQESNQRETDVLFNPLVMYEAQPVVDRKKYKEDNLIELIEEKETVLNQYKNLNHLIIENNKWINDKPTYAFIVMPNFTLMGYQPSVEVVSLLGAKSYFKKRSSKSLGLMKDSPDEKMLIQMRGFENTSLSEVESDKWYEVDKTGRSRDEAQENLHLLTMGEFITKNIPSLLVARELLLLKYSEFAFRGEYDPNQLAIEDGYRLWGQLNTDQSPTDEPQDLAKRLEFLKEYFRRTETTNLLVASRFKEKLKERGEEISSMSYGRFFFIKSLNSYYSQQENLQENEKGDILNSTNKYIWKRMHGIK